MSTTSCGHNLVCFSPITCSLPLSRRFNFLPRQLLPALQTISATKHSFSKFALLGSGLHANKLEVKHNYGVVVRAVNGGDGAYISPWDEKPFEILPNGKRVYLDEQDVVTFLDPPRELVPLDPASYNPAAYLWKKIEDIPEERRYRLLQLIKPRLISKAWAISGTRYEDPKLAEKIASKLLSGDEAVVPLEYYHCRTSGGPPPVAWMNFFRKAIFCCHDRKIYGRFIGGSGLFGFISSFYPMYFEVNELKEVMSTEQPCDLAYEFGNGLFDIHEYPQGFPKSAKHPYPFNDQVVIYIRHVGPGVLIGQAWQEGNELQQVPQKLCGEILMVKDYAALRENH